METIIINFPKMASHHKLNGKEFKVINITLHNFASGSKTYYHIIHEGQEYKISEDFIMPEKVK